MNNFENVVFDNFTRDDIDAVTQVMKRAFDEDSMRHLNRAGGPPGYDNGDFFRKWCFGKEVQCKKVLKDGKLIGFFAVFIYASNENILGTIFMDPECQDKGMGSYVWKKIEEMYPETVKWSTETPGFSRRNHNFYVNKCGFRIIHIDDPKNFDEAQYIMEKIMK